MKWEWDLTKQKVHWTNVDWYLNKYVGIYIYILDLKNSTITVNFFIKFKNDFF